MSKKFTIESTKKFIEGLFNKQRFKREYYREGKMVRKITLSNKIVIQEYVHGMGTSINIYGKGVTHNHYGKAKCIKFIKDELNKEEEIHDCLHELLITNL
jgi:hypothetical protein